MHEMVHLDGKKMSKHLGNVVDPDALLERVGADTVRLAVLYAAAPTNILTWTDQALQYCHKWLHNFWEYALPRLEGVGAVPDADPEEGAVKLRRRLDNWHGVAVRRITENMAGLETHRAARNVMTLVERIRDFERRVLRQQDALTPSDQAAMQRVAARCGRHAGAAGAAHRGGAVVGGGAGGAGLQRAVAGGRRAGGLAKPPRVSPAPDDVTCWRGVVSRLSAVLPLVLVLFAAFAACGSAPAGSQDVATAPRARRGGRREAGADRALRHADLRDAAARRAQTAVRRRAGRPDRRRARRARAAQRRSSTSLRGSSAVASRACSGSRSRPTTRAPAASTSTTRIATATRASSSTAAAPRRIARTRAARGS